MPSSRPPIRDGQLIENRDLRYKSKYLYRNSHGEAYETQNALAHTSSTAFDANGQQDILTNKRGKTYDFTPDDNGRVTSLKTPLLKETTSGWTTRGLPLFVQEPSGDRAEFIQDDMVCQRQVIYKQGTTTVATVTSHLDKQGNLKKIEETIGSVTKSVEFPDHDTRGSTIALTAGNGHTVASRYEYDAWVRET